MTTLREAALAALALVNDTLLERTVDTKRLSAVGRDLEDALDAEHAQPVAEFHAHPADWQYNITLLPGCRCCWMARSSTSPRSRPPTCRG